MLIAATILTGCTKSDTDRCATVLTTAPSDEVALLQSDLSSRGINATADSRGFFYTITRNGDSTRKPKVCSSIKVSYTLRLMNGTQLEAASNQSFLLSSLVAGWQEGLPLVGEGGFITLYLPPSLAYGSTGHGSVPPNANLMFQIELITIE